MREDGGSVDSGSPASPKTASRGGEARNDRKGGMRLLRFARNDEDGWVICYTEMIMSY